MEWEGGKNDVNIEICEEMETETEKEKGEGEEKSEKFTLNNKVWCGCCDTNYYRKMLLCHTLVLDSIFIWHNSHAKLFFAFN